MFKFIDRKHPADLVLISGWAFDYRIFNSLDLPFNYFLYCGQEDACFETALNQLLKDNQLQKISILGWSKGAFTAANFAAKHPQKIESLILVSARKKYYKDSIDVIKGYLKKNHKAFMLKFYRDCFCKDQRQDYLWFKKNLQDEYINKLTPEQLTSSLDQLCNMSFALDALSSIENVKIVHSLNDTIAPYPEAKELANSLSSSQLITFQTGGHVPFLHPDFKAALS